MDTINDIQYFVKESQFEQALVDLLPHHGWEKEVIVQPTEEDLIQNWAKILFDNNRDINKLGNYPLTASEMRQIIDQVNLCDSPYAMNMLSMADRYASNATILPIQTITAKKSI